MTDPVSLASGLAGLLSLTIQTSQILYEQVYTLKNAPKIAKELLDELHLLRKVLGDLDSFLKTQETDKELKYSSVLVRTIGTCDQRVGALKVRLERLVYSKGFANLLERGKWLYEQGEHEELMTALHRSVNLFQVCLSMDGLSLLSKSMDDIAEDIRLLKSATMALRSETHDSNQSTKQLDNILQLISPVSSISKDVTEVLNRARRLDDEEEDRESLKIKEWLSPLNFWTTQNDILSKREEGTGEWILEDPIFQDWLNGKDTILWCPGIRESLVVDHLSKLFENRETESPVVFAFCNYKEQTTQTASKILANLVKQLTDSGGMVSDEVRLLYQKHSAKETRPSIAELSELFETQLAKFKRVFIVLDALDECNDVTRHDLVAQFLRLPSNASLMVTSREIVNLEEDLATFSRLDIVAQEADVRKYLEGQLNREPRLKRHVQADPALRTAILDKVSQKVDGMFLLAQLHIESLGKKHTRKAVREALEHLPKGLDATYDNAMNRVWNQDEDDVALAKMVLCWLSYCLRPLSVQELREAVAVMSGSHEITDDCLCDEATITSVCAGLVKVDKASDIISLVHYTTQEYFERNRNEMFPNARVEIATTCLEYLSLDVFKMTGTDTILYFDMYVYLQWHPFLRYVVRYLGTHLDDETESILEARVLDFFEQNENLPYAFHAKATFLHRDRYLMGGQNAQNISALSVAAFFGLRKTVKSLIANGADVNLQDSVGFTPLRYAVIDSYEDCVRILLHEGASIKLCGVDRQSALHDATQNGNEDIAQLLLEGGADVDLKDGNDCTALMIAVGSSREGMVRLLIKNGADLYAEDHTGSTILHRAIYHGYEGVLHALIEAGVEPKKCELRGRSILSAAVLAHHNNLLVYLIKAGAALEQCDGFGMTPLHYAAVYGDTEAARLLLEYGAAIDAVDEDSFTPLHHAIARETFDLITLLLENGAAVNTRNTFGETPFKKAAVNCDEATLGMLLECGAAFDVTDLENKTPLHHAAIFGHDAIIALLLECGAFIDELDIFGSTPLCYAVMEGHLTCAMLLLEKGAAFELIDFQKRWEWILHLIHSEFREAMQQAGYKTSKIRLDTSTR